MIPTRVIRNQAPAPRGDADRLRAVPADRRGVLIRTRAVCLTARLADTPTAERIWFALPVWSTVEQWGRGAVHFSTHVGTGREADARWNVEPGDIAYWVEDDRVIIGYGMTPLSRAGEIRLPSPANIWAHTDDDVSVLQTITPGSRIDMTMLILPAPGSTD